MSQPILVSATDGFVCTWPDNAITIALSRLRDSGRQTGGELLISYRNGTGNTKNLAHQTVTNLLGPKTALIKSLTHRHEANWDTLLEQACQATIREIRKGEPIESLQPTESDQPAWFVLNPLLYQHNPTVLYGPGDSMKSFLALYCALLLCNGCSGPNLSVAPTPWRVLFLDWEMSVSDVRARVKLLQAGDPRLVQAPDYRRCVRSLADDVTEIKTVMTDGNYDVLILDSLAMAAGGQELERADSAVCFNKALRSLNCTSLIIGHTPKPQADQKESSLYGSVFFSNLTRNSWEVRREGQTMGLYHYKHNLGPKHDPLGFTLCITDTEAMITEANLMDDPVLAKGLSQVERAASYLAEHPNQTVEHVAEMLELNAKSLAVAFSRTMKKGVRRFESHNGLWNVMIT